MKVKYIVQNRDLWGYYKMKCLRCTREFTKEELWEFRDGIHENVVSKKKWVREMAKDWPHIRCPYCKGILVPEEKWGKVKKYIEKFNRDMEKARKKIEENLKVYREDEEEKEKIRSL